MQHFIAEPMVAQLYPHAICDSNKLYMCVDLPKLIMNLSVVHYKSGLMVGPCGLCGPKQYPGGFKKPLCKLLIYDAAGAQFV